MNGNGFGRLPLAGGYPRGYSEAYGNPVAGAYAAFGGRAPYTLSTYREATPGTVRGYTIAGAYPARSRTRAYDASMSVPIPMSSNTPDTSMGMAAMGTNINMSLVVGMAVFAVIVLAGLWYFGKKKKIFGKFTI